MTKNPFRTPTGPGSRSSLRSALAAAALLLVLLAVIHPDLLFRERVYGSADAGNAYSFAITGDQALAEGEYPLWNPYLFNGMPTFGSLSYQRFLYPPGEVFRFLQNTLGFPPSTWLLAHLLLGGFGMFWLLGRWNLPLPARLLGAAVWLLLPKVVAWSVYGHGSKVVTAMYLPWIVGACLGVLSGRGRRSVGLLALFLGLQILRGHVQIIYYTLLTVAVLVLAAWADALRRRAVLPLRPTLGVVLALIAAFLIGAAQLLPVHDYAAWSIRGAAEGGGASYDFATGWSFSPRELDTLVLPSMAGFGKATYVGLMRFNDYPNYLGWLVLALAGVGAALRPRRATWALLAVGLLALLVSFGKHFGLLYDPLYKLLPYFNKFRIPSMILILTGFAAAALAARGAGLLAGDDVGTGRRLRPLGFLVGGLGVLLLLGGLGIARGWYEGHLLGLAEAAGRSAPNRQMMNVAWDLHRADLLRIGALLLAGGIALLAAAARPLFRTRGLAWVLLLLVVVDLGVVGGRITHPERTQLEVVRTNEGAALRQASSMITEQPARAEILAPDPFFVDVVRLVGHERVWPLGAEAGQNTGMTAGLRSLGGYHPAKPAAFEAVRNRLLQFDEGAPRLASWLGAGWLMTDTPFQPRAFPELARLGALIESRPVLGGPRTLYRNLGALPRARLTKDWEPESGDLNAFLDRVQTGRLDPSRVVQLAAAPTPAPVDDGLPPAPVEYLEDGLNRVVLRVDSPTPAVLVLSDLWMPGWTVKVDGQTADLIRADHMLRAVALPAGVHEAAFIYRDPALGRALWLTALGVLVTLGALVFGPRWFMTGTGRDEPPA